MILCFDSRQHHSVEMDGSRSLGLEDVSCDNIRVKFSQLRQTPEETAPFQRIPLIRRHA